MRLGFLIAVFLMGGLAVGHGQPFDNAEGHRSYTSIFGGKLATSLAQLDTVPLSNSFYFPHLALGNGFQTTLTYVNYSPQSVSCQTTFFDDSGNPLLVSFNGVATSTRTDLLGPGEDLHQQTEVDPAAPLVSGWAQAECTAPVKASLLFRLYSQGVAVGEAGVNAMTVPATKFVTFAETRTGVAYANPSTSPADITISAFGSTPGPPLGSTTLTLQPGAHGSANIGPLLGLSSFSGSVQVTSTVPIVSLSLNAEAFPAFSALPPGALDDSTPLATSTGSPTPVTSPFTNTYYFPHLALGNGFQTTLTYVNYSPQSVSCQTTFFDDSGNPLAVSFGGPASASRTDLLGPGAALHQQTQTDVTAPLVAGWAQAQCTGPVKASLLFRLYSQGVAAGEAGVNAMTALATKFVTFGETRTGVAYANPSTQPATITITALNSATGLSLGSATVILQPGAHGAANIGPLLGLSSFTGSVQITSTIPIVSLSLNAEAFPAFSALPPGELDDATQLAAGR